MRLVPAKRLCHVACSEGFMNVVNLLVFVGADVNCENENRVTPLMIAFRKNDSRLACYLIENGARVDDNLAREINQRESSLLDLAFRLKSINAMRYLLSVGAELTDEYNCIDLVENWAKYPTAIQLLILSRCCVLEKEHLLWHIPTKTVERYGGQVNYLILEFFIWCFEELGYDIGDIYNILQTRVWNTKQLAELHEWMVIKMSVVPSLMAGCRKIIKNSLAQINDQVSIFPAIDQLPIPKSMKSFLKDDVYGAN